MLILSSDGVTGSITDMEAEEGSGFFSTYFWCFLENRAFIIAIVIKYHWEIRFESRQYDLLRFHSVKEVAMLLRRCTSSCF